LFVNVYIYLLHKLRRTTRAMARGNFISFLHIYGIKHLECTHL